MEAYILVKLQSGVNVEKILQDVRNKRGIKKASLVFGPYDLIIEVDVPDETTLKETLHEIHSVEGIAETLTCVVTKSL